MYITIFFDCGGGVYHQSDDIRSTVYLFACFYMNHLCIVLYSCKRGIKPYGVQAVRPL